MNEISAEQALSWASEMAESIATEVDKINERVRENAEPLVGRKLFVDQMAIEMCKLLYHKFVVIS